MVEGIYTIGQVAKIAGVSSRTAQKWCDDGRLKHYRIPGSQDRRVERGKLIAFLKEYGLPLGDLEGEGFYKVLFVGCDKPLLDGITPLLTIPEGFNWDGAPTLYEAGLLVRDFRPDVIVIDLALGRAEAVSVAKRVRDEEQGAEKGTLLVALLGEDDRPGENPWPWDEQYQKPFDPALLAERLRRGKGE